MLKYLILLSMLFCSFFMNNTARADILITPTRVVFDDKERFAEVTLANTTNKIKSYEIQWQLYEMQQDSGTYEDVKVAPEYDMSKLVFFAPRRVTLAPGGKQKIKLRFSRPADIPDGDYHVHLKFKALSEIVEPKDTDASEGTPAAKVQINISYSIPVIVRIGEPNVGASIGQISIERDQVNGKLSAKVPVERTGGPYALLGYLRVYHSDGAGKEELVGEISNAHVFPEVTRRVFTVALNKEITGGTLRVDLRHFNNELGLVYAENVFPLQ